MFKMFPVNPSTKNNNLVKINYTSKVYTLSQIYHTKGASCSSCGGGRK